MQRMTLHVPRRPQRIDGLNYRKRKALDPDLPSRLEEAQACQEMVKWATATDLRRRASRVRRLMGGMISKADYDRLRDYVENCETRAAGLDEEWRGGSDCGPLARLPLTRRPGAGMLRIIIAVVLVPSLVALTASAEVALRICLYWTFPGRKPAPG